MAEAHTWGLWTPIALEDEVQSRTLSWDVLTSPWPGSPVCLMDSCLPSPELSAQTERFPAFPRCPSLWTVPFPSVPLFPYSVWEVCLLKRSLLQVSAPFLLSPCPPPSPGNSGFPLFVSTRALLYIVCYPILIILQGLHWQSSG